MIVTCHTAVQSRVYPLIISFVDEDRKRFDLHQLGGTVLIP